MTSSASNAQTNPTASSTTGAAQTAQSYASATKKAVSSPPIATGSSAPSPAVAVGGAPTAQPHTKTSSISPANGRASIPPAVPAVAAPAVVNSNPSLNGNSSDHSRKSSVTISANGPSGYIPNGGPVGGPKSSIQFGSVTDSPVPAHSSPQVASSAPISIPGRVASPAHSPAPIPQPMASGGRPPSVISQPGNNGVLFGSLGGDGDRYMKQASVPQGPHNGPGQSHSRRESSSYGGSDMGNGPQGRGGYPPQGGRGRGGSFGGNMNNQYHQNQPQMHYPSGGQYRGPPNNQARGGMPPPAFQGQGRSMGQYPGSPHQAARSPALANAVPHPSPNMGQAMPMQPAQYSYYQPHMGAPQVHNPPAHFPTHFSDSVNNSRNAPRAKGGKATRGGRAGKNAEHWRSREVYGHSLTTEPRLSEIPERGVSTNETAFAPAFEFQPVTVPFHVPGQSRGPKLDLAPETGNFDRLLQQAQQGIAHNELTAEQQNFGGYPQQPYDNRMAGGMPMGQLYYPMPYMGQMQTPAPQSPQPGFQQPYMPGQYNQGQSLSRTPSSQMGERPASSMGQPQPSAVPTSASQTPQSKPVQASSPAFVTRAARKSAAITIKRPDNGEAVDLSSVAKPTASPAPSHRSRTPPVIASTPTPPPKSVTPQQHNRADSKTADQIKMEFQTKAFSAAKADTSSATKESETAKAPSPAVVESSKPSEPDVQVEAPASDKVKEEPAKAEEPVKEEPKPAVEEAKPVVEEVKPAAEEPKPAVEESKPAAEDPKPAAEEPKPAEDEEDEIERQIREMEEEEARREKAEAEYAAKKAAEKAAAAKLAKEREVLEAAENDRKLKEAEREMERIEDEREAKRKEAEAKASGVSTGGTTSAQTKTPDSQADDKSVTPGALASKLSNMTIAPSSGTSTPASDEVMGPPPKAPAGEKRDRGKPAALNLAPLNTKPVEPPQPSAALQSLKSARFLSVMNSELYPPNINSPNPALNSAVTTKGKSFKYDKEFLLQFQKVFTEKPSVEFDTQIKQLIGDGDGGSARSGSTRTPGGASMGPRGSRSSNAPGGFAMGNFGAISGGKTLPPGTTSAERFAMSSGSMPRPAASNPMASFSRPGGAFPGGNPMSRQPSGANMGPNSPRGTSSRGGNRQGSKRNDYQSNQKEAQAAKTMPLTAGMDLKPIQVSATGWKPRSIMASASATGAAGPAPGATGHMEPDMVQRKVKAALNKMTPEKFDKIADQILAIAAQSRDEVDGRTLRQVIQLTFEKATDEAHWASMYAKFCKRMLETMSPDIKDESILDKSGNVVSGGNLFRKYLLNRCQEEFERGWKMNLPDKPEDEKEGETKTEEAAMLSDEYYIAAAAKRRGLGLVQFIGELYKLGMLTERIMHECVKKLVDYQGVPDEAEIESLTKLLKTIGGNLDSTEKGKPLMDVYFQRIQTMIDTPELPSRLRFMLMDVVDLRKKNWHSKEDNKGPKTLEEVRAEAEAAQMAKAQESARSNQRGGGGRMQMGRGDSRNFSGGYGSQPPMDYQKNTVGMDDLRRLTNKNTNRSSSQQVSFGPTSMFSSRSNSGRKMGGALGRAGEDSGASSRTGTPPQAKEKEAATSANAFSLLAGLGSGDTETPASPPSAAASPALSKATPATESADKEGGS